MKNNKFIYLIIAILGLIILGQMSAQNKPRPWSFYAQNDQDTLKKKVVVTQAYLKPGSKEYIDSMKLARKLYIDSLKAAQLAFQDSLRKERERVADSTAKATARYNDSLKTALEAQRAERQRVTDSIKAVQAARKDSLDQLRAYRESKVYKDSVAKVKQARLDSIASVRKARADSLVQVRIRVKDSLASVRQKMQDSLAEVRQKLQDSLAIVRKNYQDSVQKAIEEQTARNKVLKDSIAAVRKIRTDSLAAAKAEREALTKKRITDRNKALNAKARNKEKKEREAYTNEKMRKKKWTILRKAVQNTTTHFNYQFNAEERLRKVEENMQKNANNQYDSLLPLYPFDPDKDSTKYASDLDSLIRKASVGIQIHDPRSKWQDNLYFIIGKSYFYKGDYKNAAAAFKYVVANAEAEKKERAKNKDKKAEAALGQLADYQHNGIFQHETSKNEAIIWLARTLAQDSALSLAQTLLNMLHSSQTYSKDLDGQFAEAQSLINLKNNNWVAASESLKTLYNDGGSPDWLRQRAAYLSGQLLQREGKYAASDSAFDKVIALNPEMEMDFNARMHRVNNSIDGGKSDPKALLTSLDRMSKEAKYKNYYDKIYFAEARLFEANRDTIAALDYYRKSIAANNKVSPQKGLAYAAMGNVYYLSNNYNAAKSVYDSSLAFLTEAENPTFSTAQQRAGALSYIADPGNIVIFNDSIMALSKLTEKEQEAIVRKHLRDLEKHLMDSFYNAKNAMATTALPGPQTLSSSKQTWYFGNPNTVQQGIVSFKQKWGDRKLKDDWNRSNLGSAGLQAGIGNDPSANMSEEDKLRATLPSEEFLLAQIPKTSKEKDSVNKATEEALYDLGIGYYKHMQDVPLALKTFASLDERYPNHKHGAEIAYYRYLIALNKNDKEAAQKYLSLIETKYADTEWGKIIAAAQKGRNKDDQNTSQMPIGQHYEQAYQALMNRNYAKVFQDAEAAPALYPNDIAPLAKKYQLLKIAAIAGRGEYKDADSLLTLFIAQNPMDETLDWAKDLQKYLQQQINRMPAQAQLSAANGPVVLPGDSSLASYAYKPKNLHYVIISSLGGDNRLIALRAGLREYNKTVPANKTLEVTISLLDGQRSVLVVQEFKDAAAAKRYSLEIQKVKPLFKDFASPSEYDLLEISNDNIIKLYTDKDWQAYKTYYQSKY